MDIADWREKIDQLDEQIVKLLCERAAAAVAIGAIKRQNAAPIYEPKREEQVYAHARSVNPGPLTGAQVQDIYERIMDVMRSLQRPDQGAGKSEKPQTRAR
jgi:chorismate mutase